LSLVIKVISNVLGISHKYILTKSIITNFIFRRVRQDSPRALYQRKKEGGNSAEKTRLKKEKGRWKGRAYWTLRSGILYAWQIVNSIYSVEKNILVYFLKPYI
jgi:hypothetical protein